MTEDRDHFVYRAYDAEGAILYVGCTRYPRKRHRTHELHSPWFAAAARCVMTGPLLKSDALAYERELIWTLRPPNNKLPRFGRRLVIA